MMRATRLHGLLACVALVVSLAPLVGCAGKQARQNTLLPAIRLAWDGVRNDAEFGGAEPVALGEMNQAVLEGEALALQAAWPPVESAAMRGIEQQLAEQKVGPIGAELKFERVRNMDEAIERMNRRFFR